MPRASAGGIELHYEQHGRGTPLLAIHGGYGGAASTLWRGPRFGELLAGFLPAVRVISYDRRSAGRSEYVIEAYDLDALASDAVAVLGAAGVDRAIVLGTSAGGMIALRLALLRPDRVAALALLSSGPSIMSTRPSGLTPPLSGGVLDRLATVRARAALLALAEEQGDRVAFESVREEFVAAPALLDDFTEDATVSRNAIERLGDDELYHRSRGAMRNMAALLEVELSPQLGELRMPVLVMHGSLDTTVPVEYGRLLRDGIPGAEYIEVPQAGHALLQESAARHGLRAWIRGTSTMLGAGHGA
jgi:pimeloyl-ACP methyl ester carboxylesterase